MQVQPFWKFISVETHYLLEHFILLGQTLKRMSTGKRTALGSSFQQTDVSPSRACLGLVSIALYSHHQLFLVSYYFCLVLLHFMHNTCSLQLHSSWCLGTEKAAVKKSCIGQELSNGHIFALWLVLCLPVTMQISCCSLFCRQCPNLDQIIVVKRIWTRLIVVVWSAGLPQDTRPFWSRRDNFLVTHYTEKSEERCSPKPPQFQPGIKFYVNQQWPLNFCHVIC